MKLTDLRFAVTLFVPETIAVISGNHVLNSLFIYTLLLALPIYTIIKRLFKPRIAYYIKFVLGVTALLVSAGALIIAPNLSLETLLYMLACTLVSGVAVITYILEGAPKWTSKDLTTR